MDRRSPFIAAALSFLVPGAGQIYLGDKAGGAVIVSLASGIWAAALASTIGPSILRSSTTVFLLGIPYLFVWIPAVTDAYRNPIGTRSGTLAGEKRGYVIWMLLVVGPMALPLLWRSARFSNAAKIAWTLGVALAFVIAVYTIIVVGPLIDEMLRQQV